MTIRYYSRVSTKAQDTASQDRELNDHAQHQEAPVAFYTDTWTGKNMNRPGLIHLLDDLKPGDTLCCWRLDRLGRTAKGLVNLFDDLLERKINFVSLKDGIDLTTPAGRLIANVLASVASYETEVRADRVRAGHARAKAEGKSWGGRKVGTRIKVSEELEALIVQMHEEKRPVMQIARLAKVSRPTIYHVLRRRVAKNSIN
jgi:DNA invertase Pin-like site-specific DNA recombinase